LFFVILRSVVIVKRQFNRRLLQVLSCSGQADSF